MKAQLRKRTSWESIVESIRLGLLFHFASGQAYFSGAAILLAAVGLSPWTKSRWPRSLRMAAVILAGGLMGLSAVPAPWFVYVLLLAATVSWLACERFDRETPGRRLLTVRWGTVAVVLSAALLELPWHFSPVIPWPANSPLDVIGDSITAGAGERAIVRWPQLLAEKYPGDVFDHARMGATARTALAQTAELQSVESFLLIEIGGNDLLGSTPPTTFAYDLRKLLSQVCRPGRTVVLFELPLPPTYNRWGLIQRKVAGEFGVRLIPRRHLAGVILTPGNTSDSLHLTQSGHTELAALLQRLLQRKENGTHKP